MGKGVAELMSEKLWDPGLDATPFHAVVDPRRSHRPCLTEPESRVRTHGMHRSHAQVTVDRVRRPSTERDGASPATFAKHEGRGVHEVNVFPAQGGDFCATHHGVEEQSQDC